MKIAFLLAALMFPLASPAVAPEHDRAPAPTGPQADSVPQGTPNLYRDRPGCASIPRQVAGEDRRYDGTRLDRQPPGKALLAVHRSVDDCPVVTFVNEERARRR